MAIVERHLSPDERFTLLVDVTDGDWTIGFEGYACRRVTRGGNVRTDWITAFLQ